MISPLLLAAAVQNNVASGQTFRDLLGPEHVSNRLDCTTHDATPGGAYPDSDASEVFLFPLRPHLRSPEERARVRYLTTLGDGRTFLREGRIDAITWEQWPRFTARLALDYGMVELASDPAVPGRVTYHGDFIVNDAPNRQAEGECRFVPPVPAN